MPLTEILSNRESGHRPLSFFASSVSALGLFGLVLLAVSFLVVGHYPPWLSFEQEALAIGGVSCFSAAVLARRPAFHLHVPGIARLATVLCVVPWLQWSTGLVSYSSDALLASSYLLLFAVACVAGAAAGETEPRFPGQVAWTLLAAGLISTGIALLQALQQNWLGVFQADLPPGGRPFANLAQPNHLATLLTVSVAATILLHGRKQLSSGTTFAVLGWLGFGVVMTGSRTGFLGALLLAGWLLAARSPAGIQISKRAVLVAVLGLIAAVIAWQGLIEVLGLKSEAIGQRLSPGTRLQHWAVLAEAAWRAPWAGYGWGQVQEAQLAAALDHPATHERLSNSHNIVLDLVLWNGFPLGGLVVAAVATWFVRRIMACRTTDQWALLAIAALVWVHALVEYPLDYAYFLVVVALTMGAVDGVATGVAPWRIPRAAAAATLIALGAIFSAIAVEYVAIQESMRTLRFVASRVGTDRVAGAPVPEVALLDQAREFHRFATAAPGTSMTPQMLDDARIAARRTPSPHALLRYAQMAGMNGRTTDATEHLALLCKLNAPGTCTVARREWEEMQKLQPSLATLPFPEVR